jgi:hypothetical protein
MGETQPMLMENSSAVISFHSDPDDMEHTEFIESGEGELRRVFRCSVEVRTALHQASVATDAIEDEIDGLDEGGSLQIPVNAKQFTAFYRKAPAQ